MFKPHLKDGTFFGLSCSFENKFFFFGSRNTTRTELVTLFPQFEFCYATQVHGRDLFEGQTHSSPTADALWTADQMKALVIQTADCIPIMLCSNNVVCAIHAGWRGVANQILKAVHLGLPEFAPTHAIIGPHIQQPNFEVGSDIAEQLFASAPLNCDRKSIVEPLNGEKARVNLGTLAKLQLNIEFGLKSTISSCGIDTVVDSRFHSFRRDRERAGRQLSFVVINR